MRTIFVAAALLATTGTALTAQEPTSEQDEVAAIVRDYYAVPENAITRGNLPVGELRSLQRESTVPAGLAKEMLPLPVDLTRRLPPVSRGQQRGRIGNRVLLIERASQRILHVVVVGEP